LRHRLRVVVATADHGRARLDETVLPPRLASAIEGSPTNVPVSTKRPREQHTGSRDRSERETMHGLTAPVVDRQHFEPARSPRSAYAGRFGPGGRDRARRSSLRNGPAWELHRVHCAIGVEAAFVETNLNAKVVWRGNRVDSWAEFHRTVKRPDQPLLARLDDYESCVLVAGCQRSGTTAVTRLLRETREMVDCRFGHDDELDGALVLAGYVAFFADGRHCFQTTYLNDRFWEYFLHDEFRLVWIIREPRAVVRSMLRNWNRAALDRLFDSCGNTCVDVLDRPWARLVTRVGNFDKACASYVAKTEQTSLIRERLGNRMLIVDYDDLVLHKDVLLPPICEFAGVTFDRHLLHRLHDRSLAKRDSLPRRQAARIDETCSTSYRYARSFCTIGGKKYDAC
jgi:hypothetical protein